MSSKVAGIVIGVVAVVAVIAGVMWLTDDAPSTTSTTGEQSQTNTESQTPTSDTQSTIEEHLEGANIGQTVDATDQERVEISITDFMYDITELTISEGTTVVWTNDGDMAHDVTSDTANTDFGSPLLSNGESYEFTFDEAGEYLYHCSPHPVRMRAAITVVE